MLKVSKPDRRIIARLAATLACLVASGSGAASFGSAHLLSSPTVRAEDATVAIVVDQPARPVTERPLPPMSTPTTEPEFHAEPRPAQDLGNPAPSHTLAPFLPAPVARAIRPLTTFLLGPPVKQAIETAKEALDPKHIESVAAGSLRHFAFPLGVGIPILLFMLIQDRIDRSDPRLVNAPLDEDREMMRFT